MILQNTNELDVLVAGAGTAGIIAALAAARMGARTLLVEQNGFVGGTATTGLPLLSFHNNRGERIVGGIPWELVTRLKELDEAAEVVNTHGQGALGTGGLEFTARNIAVRPEAMKNVALQMLQQAGVEILLRSFISDAIVDQGEIRGILVQNKSGAGRISAKRVIDCTGDGDVASRAGASFQKGRLSDGVTQPMTSLFVLTGVDLDRAEEAGVAFKRSMQVIGSERWQQRFRKYDIKFHHWLDHLRRELTYPQGVESGFVVRDWGDGVLYAGNMLHVPLRDGSNADQLSAAEVDGRLMVWELVQFMRRHVPGFEDAHLIHTYDIGVRETRRILGDYCLTYEDVLEARRFDDDIALCGYWVDIHDYDGRWLRVPEGGTQVKAGGAYAIPYRCLLPQKVESLLVAGRCLSATHEAHASARVMGTAMAMGHAAGAAAALSLKEGVSPRHLDVRLLQATLRQQAAMID